MQRRRIVQVPTLPDRSAPRSGRHPDTYWCVFCGEDIEPRSRAYELLVHTGAGNEWANYLGCHRTCLDRAEAQDDHTAGPCHFCGGLVVAEPVELVLYVGEDEDFVTYYEAHLQCLAANAHPAADVSPLVRSGGPAEKCDDG